MTIHICRDYLMNGASYTPYANMYMLTIFCSGVLGFRRIGQTSMNINPSFSGFVISGSGASINLSASKEFHVRIPTGSHVISGPTDGQSQILSLRSSNFPRSNSGLFRILSASVADNAYIIEYRTPGTGTVGTAAYPPIETGSLSGSLDWAVWPAEPTWPSGPNPENSFFSNAEPFQTYRTWGTGSNYPRTILQSPHSSSWQVRICWESYDDRWNSGMTGMSNTFSVGFNGNSLGDWPMRNQSGSLRHTHGCAFWNDVEINRRAGQQVGLAPSMAGFNAVTTGQWRVYMWGDDQTGSVQFLCRAVSSNFHGNAGFGLPDNEPLPIPADPLLRLFTYGRGSSFAPTLQVGSFNEYGNSGQAFGISGRPISMVFNIYHIIYADQYPEDFVTQDSLFLGATELLPVDVMAGTWLTGYIRSSPFGQSLFLEPRRMGIAPCGTRVGRTNFPDWTVTTDTNRLWMHTDNGMYMPWGGPPVLP